MNKFALLAMFGLAGFLDAQDGSLVVPRQYTMSEAPSLRRVAGFAANVRQQIIVAGDHLTELIGHTLTGLTFRRDRGLNRAFEGGWVALKVSLSTTPRSASAPSFIMDENVGADVVQVFTGQVFLPSSRILNAEISPWDSRCIAILRFNQGFVYGGGDLCIELEPKFGILVTELARWPVDAARNLIAGTVDSVSQSCSSFAGTLNVSDSAQNFVSDSELVLGQSAVFDMRGTPGGTALFLFGSRVEPAMSLAAFGSPNCTLDVQPNLMSFVTTFSPAIIEWAPELGGRANATIQIPANSSLLGAEFHCQWVDMGPPIMTSNTLRITFASDMPTLGMAIVSAAYDGTTAPEIGHVSIDVGHVMRFDYR